jgi:gluconolactonase
MASSSCYGPMLGLLQQVGEPAHDPNDLEYTDGVGMDAEGNVWAGLPAANKVVAILPSLEVVTVIHDLSGEPLIHQR